MAALSTMVQAQQAAPVSQQNLPDAPAPKAHPPESGLPGAAPLPPQAGVQPDQAAPPPSEAVATQQRTSPKNVADQRNLDNVIRVDVNLKIIPVTVKDGSGKIIQDLQESDFAVYEGGIRQQIRYFSSDPFPLSAAVVIDAGLPNATLDRVKQTLHSLTGAFGPYDEVAVFSYGGTVTQQSDFGTVADAKFSGAISQLDKVRGQENGGVAVNSGPLASGPMINNIPIDPTTRPRGADHPNNLRIARVMNDALLSAAQALSRRDRSRRKIILIISDGHEYNSRNSYSDVLKVILNDEIIVDAIALDTAAVPLLNKIEEIHLPRQGYGDLLPKYTNATGGTIYRELSRRALEQAYAQATFDSRSQYTIGYSPKSPNLTGEYRQFDVRVHRSGLRVYAPDGYYSLPPRDRR